MQEPDCENKNTISINILIEYRPGICFFCPFVTLRLAQKRRAVLEMLKHFTQVKVAQGRNTKSKGTYYAG